MCTGPGTRGKRPCIADLPRQSTVESGTKPPKFSLIGSPCRIILFPCLFECIELWFLIDICVSAPVADDPIAGYDYIHSYIIPVCRDFITFLSRGLSQGIFR